MKILTTLPAFMALIVAIGGCSKNAVITKPVVINKLPTSYSVEPAAAIIYSAVTISGSGFDTVKADNIVKFNGTRGLINSITPKQIIVTIPAAATSGKLTVTTKGKTIDILDTFKVFHMVQADHITFPDNIPDSISSLAFDKNGNMYGLGGGGRELLKFANGSLTGTLSTIYAPPKSKDSVNYNDCYFVYMRWGNQKVCPGILNSFYLGGTLTDSQGNIYVVQDSSITAYDVADGILKNSNKAVKTSNKAAVNPVLGDNLSILKISPAGNVTTLAKIPGRLPSITIDPAGNIYFMGNPDTTIYKITPQGTLSIFTVVHHHQFTSCICADRAGNIYVACQDAAPDFTDIQTILKYTPQGIGSILTGPTKYGFSNFRSMGFDPYGNLLAAGDPDLILINSAGYVSRLPGDNTVAIYVDYTGNLYEESENDIVKYLVK